MNEKLTSAKNFVVRNRFKIAVTVAVVSTTVAVIEQIGIRQCNAFLKEKGLFDEYYTPED